MPEIPFELKSVEPGACHFSRKHISYIIITFRGLTGKSHIAIGRSPVRGRGRGAAGMRGAGRGKARGYRRNLPAADVSTVSFKLPQ